jgi:hypothetical protein
MPSAAGVWQRDLDGAIQVGLPAKRFALPPSLPCNRLRNNALLLAAVACAGLLLYVWVGYPILVRLLASGRRLEEYGPAKGGPSVSVILATREPDSAIRDRLTDLILTNYAADNLQIIVALDSRRQPSQADLPVMAVPVRVIVGDGPGGKAAALNAGVRAASGEILVFTDTGQRFGADTIGYLVSALGSDQRLGAVSGALQIEQHAADSRHSLGDWYWAYEKRLRAFEARVHSAVGVTGAVYAMRRECWSPLPSGLILDDLFTPMRLVLDRYRVGFEERAVATDSRHFAPTAEYQRKARTLTGVLQLCVWLRPVLNPFRNPIWLQFVTHKLLRLLTPYLIVVGAISGGGVLARSVDVTVTPAAIGWTAVVATIPIAVSERLRELLWRGLLMQAAILKATFNALRGDWDVWRS